jgi:hypothetical protein
MEEYTWNEYKRGNYLAISHTGCADTQTVTRVYTDELDPNGSSTQEFIATGSGALRRANECFKNWVKEELNF